METPIEMMKIKDTDVHLKNYINRVSPEYLFGHEMEDYMTNTIFEDWCKWKFPKGVSVEDNQLYLVWYEHKEDSDPMNSSETNDVKYIERAPKEIQSLYESIDFIKTRLMDYKKERQKNLSI